MTKKSVHRIKMEEKERQIIKSQDFLEILAKSHRPMSQKEI